jgi:hypothetical protein
MMRSKDISRSPWFWLFQVVVGSICLILSIVVLFYGANTAAGAYIWLFLAGVGIMILGAERIASGLFSKSVKRSSRLINIGVGAGLIIYIGSGFFFPEIATKWLILFLGFGLLANGIIRIFSGLKKKEEEFSCNRSIDHIFVDTGLGISEIWFSPASHYDRYCLSNKWYTDNNCGVKGQT